MTSLINFLERNKIEFVANAIWCSLFYLIVNFYIPLNAFAYFSGYILLDIIQYKFNIKYKN